MLLQVVKLLDRLVQSKVLVHPVDITIDITIEEVNMVISVVEIMINMGEMISSEDKMKISVVNFMISMTGMKINAVEMIINVVDIREGFKKQNGNFVWHLPLSFEALLLYFFFLLQLNLTYIKRILHLVSIKNITFKSSYNWF